MTQPADRDDSLPERSTPARALRREAHVLVQLRVNPFTLEPPACKRPRRRGWRR